MAEKTEKQERSQASARRIAEGLRKMGLPPRYESERQWIQAAGVSASFFTNLRGSAAKPPSDPSVGNLRRILEAAGSSLPEFFAGEAKGRVVRPPTRQEIEQAIADALEDLPARGRERRVEYLASTFERLLGLPKSRRATRPAADRQPAAAPARAARSRAATRSA